MWRSFFWLPLVATACGHPDAPASKPDEPPCQVLTDQSQLAACVGKRVTIRGPVSRSKIPSILGVDVAADYALSDQLGEATGTLATYTIEPQPPGELVHASKGPGTYYILHDGEAIAKARPAR